MDKRKEYRLRKYVLAMIHLEDFFKYACGIETNLLERLLCPKTLF